MGLEFVGGSGPCFEGFSPGSLATDLPALLKTNIVKFQLEFDPESEGHRIK